MAKLLLYPFLVLALLACSSTDGVDEENPEILYKEAIGYQEDERYEEALIYFEELKNKHPYSKYATESELRIANIHFIREAWPEAENAYKLFKEFHPKHPKSDYVTFRIAMSIFKQLPDSIDRDLSLAKDAMLYFEQVFINYPQSDYSGSAKDHKNKCLLKLARKEFYIGNFYLIRETYDSALPRFEGILKNYPNVGVDARALYGAAVSAFHLKENEKASRYYKKLVNSFPKTKWAKKITSELEGKI